MGSARTSRPTVERIASRRMGLVTGLLLIGALLVGVSPASAAEPAAPVVLGSAADFSVLAGPSVTNTGDGTVLALDLGSSGTVTGFPPGKVTGTAYVADETVETAQEDRQAAYDSVVAQTGGTEFTGDLAGKTFTPGLHTTAAAVTNTGTITLDAAGDPSAIFVFQVGAALSSAAATKVVLANGALANNVYWQVVGAVSLGANVKFVGTFLAAGVVSFGDGASLKGRVLTPGTVALANSPITKPIDDLVAPVVTIDGGATRSINDTTPSISGTTDEPGTPLVTVRVRSQVLTARAADGVWTVSADALVSGPHDVVASVTDPSGNIGTATQVLTIDTTAPVVAITGGANVATKDTSPTIAGTTDEAGTPTVAVTVEDQTLTTVAADGAWSVDAGVLGETSHQVHASVQDEAGNTGVADQVLTVDLTVPVLTIVGGESRSTDDLSPWIYGTTAEQAGTIVNVKVGGQSLTAVVETGGGWGVSAQTLASGTYTVLASITDAAQNTGSMTQTLQVGPVVTAPTVTIEGGTTRSTTETTPVISGTTGEPGSPTVTVTVNGQTLTTTAAAGRWSVTPATLAPGAYKVTASVTASSGTGSATQTLTITTSTSDDPPETTTPPVAAPEAPIVGSPVAAPTYRPDAEIRLGKRAFAGRGTYSLARQKVSTSLNGRRAKTATYTVRVTNRGDAADRLTIRGTAKSKQFTVVYLKGRKNVTSAVLKGTYRTGTLRPGQSETLTVRVTKVTRAKKGSKRTFAVTIGSATDRAKVDTVGAVVKVARA